MGIPKVTFDAWFVVFDEGILGEKVIEYFLLVYVS